jgi:hypothetical protein
MKRSAAGLYLLIADEHFLADAAKSTSPFLFASTSWQDCACNWISAYVARHRDLMKETTKQWLITTDLQYSPGG